MKKFIIDQEVWNLFPNMHIGVLVFKNPKKELTKEETQELGGEREKGKAFVILIT